MDPCFPLIGFGVGLFFLALIGHGLWLLFAAICRAMFKPDEVRPKLPTRFASRIRCPRCNTSYFSDVRFCPECELMTNGPLAEELRDLEGAAKCLQTLQERKTVDPDLAEKFYEQIEARQAFLLRNENGRAPKAKFDVIETPIEPPVLTEAEPEREPALRVVEQVAPPPMKLPPPLPHVPRRSWGEMFAGFMEERNIMWGELVGGLLIVGCSIALVVSLWRTLEEQLHSFPFLVMTALTAALFSAGQYSLRHWKLESTSRGLLVITVLLTPLSFLVLAGLSPGRIASWVDWLLGIGAVSVYSAMVYYAGRVTTRPQLFATILPLPLYLTIVVIGASASQLFVTFNYEVNHPTIYLSYVPVVLQAIVLGMLVYRWTRENELSPHQANSIHVFISQTEFAVVIALSLLTYQGLESIKVLNFLAGPVALAGWPALMIGAMTFSRVRRTDIAADDDAVVPRITGTIIAIVGALAVLASIVLAWPRPTAITGLGVTNGLFLLMVAHLFRWPAIHVGATVCLSVGVLTGFHWLRGGFDFAAPLGPQLLAIHLTPAGATGLTIVAGIMVLIAEVYNRRQRTGDAAIYRAAAGLASLVAIIVSLRRVMEPAELQTALVFAINGFGILLFNLRTRLAELTMVGAIVVLGFIAQLVGLVSPDITSEQLWLISLLTHASLFGVAGIILNYKEATSKVFGRPMVLTAMLTGVLAILPLFGGMGWNHLTWATSGYVWIGLVWLVLGFHLGNRGLFVGGQLAFVNASVLGTMEWLLEAGHVKPVFADWSQMIHVQRLAIGPAIVGFSFAVLKWLTRNSARWQNLLEPEWGGFDRLVLILLVIGQGFLAFGTVQTEVTSEIFTGSIAQSADLANGGLAWLLIGILAAGLFIGFVGKHPAESAVAFYLLLVTLPLWIASAFREQLGVAPALIWLMSISFVVLSIPLLFARTPSQTTETKSVLISAVRTMLIALKAVPVIYLCVCIGGRIINQLLPVGPVAGSFLAMVGWPACLIGSMSLIAIGLSAMAIRFRSQSHVLAAGYLLVLTIVGGRAVLLAFNGIAFSTAECVLLTWLGVLTIALWTVPWILTSWARHGLVVGFQIFSAGAATITLLTVAVIELLTHLDAIQPLFVMTISQPLGWISVVVSMLVWMAATAIRSRRHVIHVVALAGLSIGVLLACTFVARDPTGWTSYHVLTLSMIAVASLLLTASWLGTAHSTPAALVFRETMPAWTARRWIDLLSIAVVVMAFNGIWADPDSPHWSCWTATGIAVLLAAVAIWVRRPGYVYLAGILLQIVAYFYWQWELFHQWGVGSWMLTGPGVTDRFFLFQALAAAIGSAVWASVEIVLRRQLIDVRNSRIPYVHVAAFLALQLISILVLNAFIGSFTYLHIHIPTLLSWSALGLTIVALVIQFRDPEAGYWGMPAPALYVAGLLAVGLMLQQSIPDSHNLLMAVGPALALYILAASVVIRVLPVKTDTDEWYLFSQTAVGLLCVALSLWNCVHQAHWWERLVGPATVAILMGACLAPTRQTLAQWMSEQQRKTEAGLLGLLFLLELAWSFVDPALPDPWLHRHAWLFIVLCVSAALATWQPILIRIESNLTPAKVLAVVAAIDLIGFLVHELFRYDPQIRRTMLSRWDMMYVVALLLTTVAVLVRRSVKHFTAESTDLARRQKLVWIAEWITLALLVHLRLNVPDYLPKFFGQYWYFVLMAWGLIFVSMGEFFRRRGVAPLALPLHQTGLFLPLVPLAAYLIRPVTNFTQLADVVPGLQPILRYLDRLPSNYNIHSLLWFMLGAIYALVALFRRSTGFALAAALAGNFGMWVLFANDPAWAFTLHPQFWLLPIGLILLVAEYLNRNRIPARTAQLLRIGGLLITYGSSAADMFIAGLGNSIVLPIVLALLSVLGVLAGILFRVRGYLFAGMAFLFLVVFSQIWHAAVNRQQTWVWWASGIVLGLAILALFAVFEKRKAKVVEIVEGMKEWR